MRHRKQADVMKKKNELSPKSRQLLREAAKVQKRAYAPYSRFKVGAAVRSRDGKIFYGCNLDNAAFPATICAEQAAIAKAISEGKRDLVELALVTSYGEPVAPCGVCRQVMAEFMKPDAKVNMASAKDLDEVLSTTFGKLVPFSFSGEKLPG